MQISFRVDIEPLARKMDEAGRRARSMRPAWREVSQIMLRSVRKNFAEGGRPSWPPRKDSLPHPLLIKSGRLLASIRARSSQSGAEVSANRPYAAVHQYGSGNIPARPYLMLQRDDERDIIEAIEQHILRPLV